MSTLNAASIRPRHIELDGRISRIQLTAKGVIHRVMNPSSWFAQIDGSEAEQLREDGEHFVPPKLRSADVENRLDGAVAVHERQDVCRQWIERQQP